eukprot:917244_1
MDVEANSKKWTTMGLSEGRKSAVALFSRFVEDKRNSRIDLYEDLVIQAIVDMIDMPETEWRFVIQAPAAILARTSERMHFAQGLVNAFGKFFWCKRFDESLAQALIQTFAECGDFLMIQCAVESYMILSSRPLNEKESLRDTFNRALFL